MMSAGGFISRLPVGRKTIRYWIIPVLVALLLLVTTAGVTFHHHANSSDANCPICHLNHLSVGLQVAAASAAPLVTAGASPDIRDPEFVQSPVAHRLPARAPPLS
jgi:hypothetical protein